MVDQYICFENPEFGMENYRFNYTKNSDFVETLRNVSSKMFERFEKRVASFNQKMNPPYAETLTRNGIGFTFNLADDILNFDL